ncbi:hypothetical protein [Rothia mucilaginosa]|uniref:Uncharacterized protein n=1 Tax=Rothia mucilaginosa TaxID=43675 RepID=A0A0K2RXG0_9MICC|nr:hypothetical protein [Rothia mucilaginosa]BAS19262.1 hypothetical protein RM6536_0015 [Rothia mucilaginosa]
MEFINKYAPILIPLLTAIAGLLTAWFKTRAARAEAKKAEAGTSTGGTTQKLSVGTINGNGNRVQNTHQQVGNGSAAISGDGNRTTIDNSQHTHNHAPSKKGHESDDDTWGNIAIAFGGGPLIMGAFLISWPTISWTLVAYWVTCLALIGWQVKLLNAKSTSSSAHAILNVLYPASLLAIVGGTWFTLIGAGKYNMATIYTTISGHYESHPQGGMAMRFIEAVTASYGAAGFTLIMLNLLTVVFMAAALLQCFKYSVKALNALYRGNLIRPSVQEASMSFFLAVVSLVACQPALTEHLIAQINK